MTLFGWDASDFDHNRGPMDLASAARDGISFYTHKATEGTSIRHNPGPSLRAARDAGIPFIGVYMVPRSGPTAAAQVSYLLSFMDGAAPWWKTFPGWFWQMDTEHWSYDAVSAAKGHECAQVLMQRTGKKVLHYAPEWAYGSSVPSGLPLWASAYVSGSGNYRTLYPGDGNSRWHSYSGRQPSVLQYTSSATIGRQPGCDANAFRGTADDFAAMIGATPVTTVDDPPPEVHDMTLFTATKVPAGTKDCIGSPVSENTRVILTPNGPLAMEYGEIIGAWTANPALFVPATWARLGVMCAALSSKVDIVLAKLGVAQSDLTGLTLRPGVDVDMLAVALASKLPDTVDSAAVMAAFRSDEVQAILTTTSEAGANKAEDE